MIKVVRIMTLTLLTVSMALGISLSSSTFIPRLEALETDVAGDFAIDPIDDIDIEYDELNDEENFDASVQLLTFGDQELLSEEDLLEETGTGREEETGSGTDTGTDTDTGGDTTETLGFSGGCSLIR